MKNNRHRFAYDADELGEMVVEVTNVLEELEVLLGELEKELSRVSGMFLGESDDWESEEDYEDIDEFEFDTNVLYAVPGSAFEVVDEDYAIADILKNHHDSNFKMHNIARDLFAVYPTDTAIYTVKGHVIIEGPLYVCHACAKDSVLAEVKFKEAAMYLALHAIYCPASDKQTDNVKGFFLVKED